MIETHGDDEVRPVEIKKQTLKQRLLAKLAKLTVFPSIVGVGFEPLPEPRYKPQDVIDFLSKAEFRPPVKAPTAAYEHTTIMPCAYCQPESYCGVCMGVGYIKITLPTTDEIVAYNRDVQQAKNGNQPRRGGGLLI